MTFRTLSIMAWLFVLVLASTACRDERVVQQNLTKGSTPQRFETWPDVEEANRAQLAVMYVASSEAVLTVDNDRSSSDEVVRAYADYYERVAGQLGIEAIRFDASRGDLTAFQRKRYDLLEGMGADGATLRSMGMLAGTTQGLALLRGDPRFDGLREPLEQLWRSLADAAQLDTAIEQYDALAADGFDSTDAELVIAAILIDLEDGLPEAVERDPGDRSTPAGWTSSSADDSSLPALPPAFAERWPEPDSARPAALMAMSIAAQNWAVRLGEQDRADEAIALLAFAAASYPILGLPSMEDSRYEDGAYAATLGFAIEASSPAEPLRLATVVETVASIIVLASELSVEEWQERSDAVNSGLDNLSLYLLKTEFQTESEGLARGEFTWEMAAGQIDRVIHALDTPSNFATDDEGFAAAVRLGRRLTAAAGHEASCEHVADLHDQVLGGSSGTTFYASIDARGDAAEANDTDRAYALTGPVEHAARCPEVLAKVTAAANAHTFGLMPFRYAPFGRLTGVLDDSGRCEDAAAWWAQREPLRDTLAAALESADPSDRNIAFIAASARSLGQALRRADCADLEGNVAEALGPVWAAHGRWLETIDSFATRVPAVAADADDIALTHSLYGTLATVASGTDSCPEGVEVLRGWIAAHDDELAPFFAAAKRSEGSPEVTVAQNALEDIATCEGAMGVVRDAVEAAATDARPEATP